MLSAQRYSKNVECISVILSNEFSRLDIGTYRVQVTSKAIANQENGVLVK